jgi:hypothetical protein
MCLLDWFAGQALTAMSMVAGKFLSEDGITAIAAEAYTLACAMMYEREDTLTEIRGQVKAKCEAANAAERKVYEANKAREQEAAEAA